MSTTAGTKFRQALEEEKPLQIVGTINAYTAILAKHVGFRAIYLSGAGVANSSYGVPDIGLTTLNNVLEDINRITEAVSLPLLVDIDTGWGNALMIQRAVRAIEKAGAAGVHIEDQVFEKRCGHLPGKELVSQEEMAERIMAAVEAKQNPDFIVMARTDAYSSEGLQGAIERAQRYESAGADMLFPEAIDNLDHYAALKEAVDLPILANITEYGKSPLYTREELASVGVDLALYPLSANRAMNLAALKVFETIRKEGTQRGCLDEMQTREELYYFLQYEG